GDRRRAEGKQHPRHYRGCPRARLLRAPLKMPASSTALSLPRTRIVVTVGPACSTVENIQAALEAGASVFRLNFSHGSHAEHEALIASIRQAADGIGRP